MRRLKKIIAQRLSVGSHIEAPLSHPGMKAAVSMISACAAGRSCSAAILYVFAVVWITASIATLWWLRTVFARYETTHALPIEYGAVNRVGKGRFFLTSLSRGSCDLSSLQLSTQSFHS